MDEYKEVAALICFDIDILAKTHPDNMPIQALKMTKDKIISDSKYRKTRYDAGMLVFNMKVK